MHHRQGYHGHRKIGPWLNHHQQQGVREDGVCCNSFTASGDVENRIARLKVLLDVILGVWSSSMPGGDIESVLDAGWGCPCKEWA